MREGEEALHFSFSTEDMTYAARVLLPCVEACKKFHDPIAWAIRASDNLSRLITNQDHLLKDETDMKTVTLVEKWSGESGDVVGRIELRDDYEHFLAHTPCGATLDFAKEKQDDGTLRIVSARIRPKPAKSTGGWFHIDDFKPPAEGNYIVWDGLARQEATYKGGRFYCFHGETDPTHWHLLPDAPCPSGAIRHEQPT